MVGKLALLLSLSVASFGTVAQQIVAIQSAATGGGTATWTLVQHGYNFTCGSSACTLSTSTTGANTRAISTTTSGDLVVLLISFYGSLASTPPLSSSAASGDTLTHCPSNWPSNYNFLGANNWNGTDCYYVVSSGADSTFTYTPTWAGGASSQALDFEVLEYKRSSGTSTYDTGNVTTSNTCSTSCVGPTLSGFSGSNTEVCVQWLASNTLVSTTINGSYSNPTDVDSNNVYGAFAGNLSVSSYSAPTWSGSASGGSDGSSTAAACWK
jgi:hypothetical protein